MIICPCLNALCGLPDSFALNPNRDASMVARTRSCSMTSRLSSDEYPRTRRFSFNDSLLWALLLLSVVYYVVLLIDLILHPTARAVGVDGGSMRPRDTYSCS